MLKNELWYAFFMVSFTMLFGTRSIQSLYHKKLFSLQQMKSPSQSIAPSNMGNTQLPASPNSKQFGFGQLQSRNTNHTQRFSSMGIQQFGPKFNLPIQQAGTN